MHLVLNASDLGRQRGGNESYLLGLLEGLVTAAPEIGARVGLLVAGEGARLVRAEPRFRAFEVHDAGPYRRLPFLLWQQTALLRRRSAEAHERPRPEWYVSTFFLPLWTPCRAAVLVHDLSFRAQPDYFPRGIALYMRLLTGLAVRRADRVDRPVRVHAAGGGPLPPGGRDQDRRRLSRRGRRVHARS